MLVHGPTGHFLFHEHDSENHNGVEICHEHCEKHDHGNHHKCEWMQVIQNYSAENINIDFETSKNNYSQFYCFSDETIINVEFDNHLSRAPPQS